MQKLSNGFEFDPTNIFKRTMFENKMQLNFNSILVQIAKDLIKFKELEIDLMTLANDFETDSKPTLKTDSEQRTKTQIKYKGIEVGSIETILKIEGNNAVYSVEFTPLQSFT